MINIVETKEIDGKVFVDMEGLLNGLFAVANTWTNMQHGPNKEEAAQKILGMIDMCQALETCHEAWKRQHDLV